MLCSHFERCFYIQFIFVKAHNTASPRFDGKCNHYILIRHTRFFFSDAPTFCICLFTKVTAPNDKNKYGSGTPILGRRTSKKPLSTSCFCFQSKNLKLPPSLMPIAAFLLHFHLSWHWVKGYMEPFSFERKVTNNIFCHQSEKNVLKEIVEKALEKDI